MPNVYGYGNIGNLFLKLCYSSGTLGLVSSQKNVFVACSCHKYKRINNTHADPNFTSPCVATKTRNYSLILSFHLLFLAKKIYRTYKTIQTIFCLIWFYFRGLPSYKNLKLGIFSFAIFMYCKLWNFDYKILKY